MRSFKPKFSILKPTKQRKIIPTTIGFDIETANKNKTFILGSLVADGFTEVFYNKDDLINFLTKKKLRSCHICASNLGFDFFGLFYGDERIKGFNTLFRGSQLILCWSYIKGGKFYRKRIPGSWRINFIDTFNYCPFSVEKLGKVIGIKKLDKPSFLGEIPKNKEEWKILEDYNIRDSQVSKKFMDFLYNAMNKLGASPKITIASSSMSLFKNKYLDRDYFRHSPSELMEQFKSYYGGRTEVFCRGLIKNYYYYDINSLYPSVMLNGIYPNPNTKRICFLNTNKYINKYEGCSHIDIYVPKMFYPPLPVKAHKVIFPYGNLSGWWSHAEIRYAVSLGCVITKVHKTYYFKENVRPFYNFVTDLYNLRLKFKKECNPMEIVVKLLMNSLYGKFGQKFIDRDNVIPFNHTPEELGKFEWFERIGDFLRIKKSFSEPPPYTIPIWASYVTSYARIELHKLLIKYKPVYCDTDSILTKHECAVSNKLGALKLEMKIHDGIIVKPKFYGLRQSTFKDGKREEYVKIKGLGCRVRYKEFLDLALNPTFKDKDILHTTPLFKKKYDKFTKFKEAIRRGFIPNEIVDITKHLTLEDDKRIWKDKFSPTKIERSEPLLFSTQMLIKDT